MASWADAQEQAKQAQDAAAAGGLFVRLKDHGDKARVVIVGDPEVRKVYWEGEKSYQWTEGCGHKPKNRWLLNAFDVDERKMKIIECNLQLFQAFAAVRDKFPFADWILEVKRNGRARDTKTTYSVLPDKQLDAAQRTYILKQDPHDLTQYTNPAKSYDEAKREMERPPASINEAVNEFQDDDIPF